MTDFDDVRAEAPEWCNDIDDTSWNLICAPGQAKYFLESENVWTMKQGFFSPRVTFFRVKYLTRYGSYFIFAAYDDGKDSALQIIKDVLVKDGQLQRNAWGN